MGETVGYGTPWAVIGLHLLSKSFQLGHQESIFIGSAHLLGLLIERAQRDGGRLEEKAIRAEDELRKMKLIRAEDAKANEKVVSIFASHEQSWLAERKSLRLQIRALTAKLQSLAAKNEDAVSSLSYRVTEAECALRIKDEAFDEEARMREELEEKLELAEKRAEELSEEGREQAEALSEEIGKLEAALAELTSNCRQLEEELARALEHGEATRKQLNEKLEREKEAVLMAEKLSDEIVKLQCEAEQKDRILSALLRKSKLDAQEKQMLLKEVKISKAKKKQAELEIEKWRNKCESRNNKKGSRSSYSLEAGSSEERKEEQHMKGSGINSSNALLVEYFETERRRECQLSETKAAIKSLNLYSSDELSDHGEVSHDVQYLREWVRLDTEKYARIIEQKHFSEIEAFTEQMRLKDEKLEALRWQMLSSEIESKRYESHIEGLEDHLSLLREENFELKSLMVDKEEEMKSLKDQFCLFAHRCQRSSSQSSTSLPSPEPPAKMKTGRRKERDLEAKTDCSFTNSDSVVDRIIEEANSSSDAETLNHLSEIVVTEIRTVNSIDSVQLNDDEDSTKSVNQTSEEEEDESYSHEQARAKQEIEEEKEVNIDSIHTLQPKATGKLGADQVRSFATVGQSARNTNSSWKMDIQALGVTYKIKRLKQQLLVLEKLAGMKQTMINEDTSDSHKESRIEDNKQHLKGFTLVIHLLNKQVKRFQSLEERTDDLCKRMHENSRVGNRKDSNSEIKEQRKRLEGFLEETFQLQRYMVATGQKMMDIQSKIASSFVRSDGLDESAGFNMDQFADVIRTLFREIQSGLEIRIARIIGDIEGTLTFSGIQHK